MPGPRAPGRHDELPQAARTSRQGEFRVRLDIAPDEQPARWRRTSSHAISHSTVFRFRARQISRVRPVPQPVRRETAESWTAPLRAQQWRWYSRDKPILTADAGGATQPPRRRGSAVAAGGDRLPRFEAPTRPSPRQSRSSPPVGAGFAIRQSLDAARRRLVRSQVSSPRALLCRDCGSRTCACCRPDPRDLRAHLALARVGERPPSSMSTSLLVRTSSGSAAFAWSGTAALAGEGRATGIARASVDGVELHMRRDVGVCSIGYNEVIAVLLLRQQREHVVQPVPGLWNGRAGELDRAVRRLLLVTVAKVRLKDAALRRHRLHEVFDSYSPGSAHSCPRSRCRAPSCARRRAPPTPGWGYSGSRGSPPRTSCRPRARTDDRERCRTSGLK